jgi:hypothetical protein
LGTAGHAIFLAISWANLNPTGGDVFAILAVIGVALVEGFAALIAAMFAVHAIRDKQKPAAVAIEGLWVLFAAINLISSYSMRHGGEMPQFVNLWVMFGFPISGLVIGVLFYMVKRLDPNAVRAEEEAEAKETLGKIEHDAKMEVLDSPQMETVVRQAVWLQMPYVVGRQMNLSDAQIEALRRQAPQLLDLNQNGVPDIHESQANPPMGRNTYAAPPQPDKPNGPPPPVVGGGGDASADFR